MFINSNAIPELAQHIEALQVGHDEAVMILFAEDNIPEIPILIERLNAKNIQFFGGLFPGLIYGNEHKTSGCILQKFKCLVPPFCVFELASSKLTGMPHSSAFSNFEHGTAMVLVDGLTPNIYRFLEKLNDLLGGQCDFIGGGAGSISLKQQPCVFSNQGFMEDAALVCIIEKKLHLGVRHGWEQLAGPMVATKTDGNTILELNWQSALGIYNAIVEKDCGQKLNEHNFSSIAQGYPFGIFKEKEDDIVRDPLAIGPMGAIVCIGEVQPNTVLHILKGRPEALLQAAQIAIKDCAGAAGLPIQAESTFVVDCITRALFLGEQFTDELNCVRQSLVITENTQEPYGILSLGEISSYGDGMLELFNKTIVIGSFH